MMQTQMSELNYSVKKSEGFLLTGTVWPRHVPTAKLLGGCASTGSK